MVVLILRWVVGHLLGPLNKHMHMCSSGMAVQLDEFKLDLGNLDLGELQRVDIGFATKQSVSGVLGGLVGKKWNLTSVEVTQKL